ncbi:hypothetical protein CDAR_26151 [Caerostris darwini]|uniref:Uncharacterized protein n=1 Tax=Caerostris darwini TaxID=1538125 RepID=A0AAV4N8J1_9ARAC|nr:hypothetical protein CDAR_26151 [Caerostris darwini]
MRLNATASSQHPPEGAERWNALQVVTEQGLPLSTGHKPRHRTITTAELMTLRNPLMELSSTPHFHSRSRLVFGSTDLLCHFLSTKPPLVRNDNDTLPRIKIHKSRSPHSKMQAAPKDQEKGHKTAGITLIDPRRVHSQQHFLPPVHSRKEVQGHNRRNQFGAPEESEVVLQ